MATAPAADIRNIALVGHSASGKTTLGEALLFKAGVTTRLGNVEDGSSVLDFDDESRERKHSVDASGFFLTHQGKLINGFDTPGMPDYCGQSLGAMAAADTAIVVVSAASGVGVNTRRMFNAAGDYGLARMIVVTRIDSETANLEELYSNLRESFGTACHAINLPADGGRKVVNVFERTEGPSDLLDVAHAHTELIDAIVESDETLMTEYMESGTVAAEKLLPAIGVAVASGHLIPMLFVNSKAGVGIPELLDALITFAPSPEQSRRRMLVTGEGEAAKGSAVEPSANGEFLAQVVRVMADPKSNIRYAIARVLSGSIGGDGQVYVPGDRKGHRVGHIFKIRGAHHEEIPQAAAGDVVAFPKLEVAVGATLAGHALDGTVRMPRFPTPMFALALEPKARGDVEKISGVLHRFADEDRCFEYHRDPETHELVIQGMGDQHLTVVRSKMKRYFKLEVDTKAPKIPYRETITGSAKYVEYTHKKQTGGAGQFAKVAIDLEANERGKGYEFVDKIFGGAIDLAFRPSVDKGIREQIKRGVIAGYPVVDVKVYLVDGKTHPVDSKDIAFQLAGRQAFKKAFAASRPILLEPVVNLEVTVPADNMGEITRDIAGKRGSVAGQDVLPGNQCVIRATVPLAEVSNYSSQLKSVTAGQGSYSMEFSHYDVVPPNVQAQIVAAHKPKDEEEE